MRPGTRLLALAFLAAGFSGIALVAAPVKQVAKRVTIGPNVVLEIDGAKRRVIVTSQVCLRQGPLEGLLTRTKKKEHEYILAADIDARHLHTALTLAGAKHGAPVQFAPYKPASGTPIKVFLRYTKGGKMVTVAAHEWIRNTQAKKTLDKDWVFAGSRFVPNAEDKNKSPDYIANHGDIVCLCNMESAVLDLPIKSPKKFDDRVYEAHTDRIPEMDTKVEVIFEPVLGKKAGGK